MEHRVSQERKKEVLVRMKKKQIKLVLNGLYFTFGLRIICTIPSNYSLMFHFYHVNFTNRNKYVLGNKNFK